MILTGIALIYVQFPCTPKCSMFGDPRELVLHYYLADDTIEILEKLAPNSGRDALPVFLKRGPLPKVILL